MGSRLCTSCTNGIHQEIHRGGHVDCSGSAGMWLEAVLTKDDLQDLFEQFAPLTIRLGESGELTLDAPSDVTFDSTSGVRVVCRAKLEWSILGLHVPVTIHSLIVLITPVIERPGAEDEALV